MEHSKAARRSCLVIYHNKLTPRVLVSRRSCGDGQKMRGIYDYSEHLGYGERHSIDPPSFTEHVSEICVRVRTQSSECYNWDEVRHCLVEDDLRQTERFELSF